MSLSSGYLGISFGLNGISVFAKKEKRWSRRTTYFAHTLEAHLDAIAPSSGLIVNKGLLTKQLRSLCEARDLSNQMVAIAVPSMLCFFTHIELKDHHLRLSRAEVVARLQPHLPCDIERLVIDYCVYAGKDAATTKVVACVAKRESLAPYVEIAQSVGRAVISVVPNIYAVAAYVESLDPARRQGCFSVVRIEGGSIEILVCNEGVPIAHDRVALDLDKLSYSCPALDTEDGESSDPLFAPLTQALRAMLRKVGSDFAVREVVFTGGGPIVDRLVARFQGALGVPCAKTLRIVDKLTGSLGEPERREVMEGRYDDVLGVLELLGAREGLSPTRGRFKDDLT